ncbi:phage tail protein [Pedobacter sp. HMF7647]|uniref:Phage tail protein n=1 Tax=Hufsiella arboris TaxID=2695275 RepID=A0A7K1Y6C6_9SPHI|nr:phage tail protein [Hufsiella arboris]MXV49669.1 phage tail protein [Hufsiella arboris]
MSLISGIIDGLIYPPPGFHFLVVIEMFPQTPQDIRFQSVSGLSVNIATETVAEGGENRFKHQFPNVPQFNKLVLKRGMFIGSFITNWCKNAIENFEFEPKNVLISLLNDSHIPLNVWHVFNAYPTKIDVSEFNAEQNTLVIETLELTYQYFKPMGIGDLVTGAIGAVAGAVSGGISGSVSF